MLFVNVCNYRKLIFKKQQEFCSCVYGGNGGNGAVVVVMAVVAVLVVAMVACLSWSF